MGGDAEVTGSHIAKQVAAHYFLYKQTVAGRVKTTANRSLSLKNEKTKNENPF